MKIKYPSGYSINYIMKICKFVLYKITGSLRQLNMDL